MAQYGGLTHLGSGFKKAEKTQKERSKGRFKEQTNRFNQVKERTPVVSTMPSMFTLLKKGGVRDVVAYLASLKAK